MLIMAWALEHASSGNIRFLGFGGEVLGYFQFNGYSAKLRDIMTNKPKAKESNNPNLLY